MKEIPGVPVEVTDVLVAPVEIVVTLDADGRVSCTSNQPLPHLMVLNLLHFVEHQVKDDAELTAFEHGVDPYQGFAPEADE